jgi:hypothetical protein
VPLITSSRPLSTRGVHAKDVAGCCSRSEARCVTGRAPGGIGISFRSADAVRLAGLWDACVLGSAPRITRARIRTLRPLLNHRLVVGPQSCCTPVTTHGRREWFTTPSLNRRFQHIREVWSCRAEEGRGVLHFDNLISKWGMTPKCRYVRMQLSAASKPRDRSSIGLRQCVLGVSRATYQFRADH